VAFSRTARLPRGDDPSATLRRVVAEVGRTLAVALEQSLGPETIERAYVFGSAEEHRPLVEELETRFELTVQPFDPFQAVSVRRKAIPPAPGRFAALLGMLLDEVQGPRHAVDFLHPRRPPKPPNRARFAASVAALVLIAGTGIWYWQSGELAQLDSQIADLQTQYADRKQLAKRAMVEHRVYTAVAAWQASQIDWLDEMRDLSLRFPPGKDVVVLRMSLAPGRRGGGSVVFNGLARDPKIVTQMEAAVRDYYHDVRSKRVQERGTQQSYAWSFETSISVAPRPLQDYLAHLPPPAGATPAALAGSGAAQAQPDAGPAQSSTASAPGQTGSATAAGATAKTSPSLSTSPPAARGPVQAAAGALPQPAPRTAGSAAQGGQP